jgi:hypothetical protein
MKVKENQKSRTTPYRQPGYLSETRGFPSPPHSEFGFVLHFMISKLLNYCQENYKLFNYFLRGCD